MSERKNIDRLFQEKFKDFEAQPSDEVWGNIEAKLDGKKKRRIVPFWWKLSGIAAVFLIGFLVSKSIYDDGVKTEIPVVNQNNANPKDKNTIEDVHIKNLKNNTIPTENPVVNDVKADDTNGTTAADVNNKNNGSSASTGTVTTAEMKTATGTEIKNKKGSSLYSGKSGVAEKGSSDKRSLKNDLNSAKETSQFTEAITEKSQRQVAQDKNGNDKISAEKATTLVDPSKKIVQNDGREERKNATPDLDKKNINLDDLKGNVNSKIATKEVEQKVNDTAPKNSVANNELEELLNEKESKLKKESKKNRWQLASNVAPIFLGSVSNGSPIDSTLTNNSKSYNTNVGFGVAVSYAVSNKLSIRTGLNKVNMSYDTNDISFFTGIQAKTLQGVSPAANSAMIHVESNVGTNQDITSETGLLPFENSFVHKNSGYLRQEMGYLEMPVEMTYNLLDKKFGVKIIGGFSTLFLQDNSITIISEGRDTFLGEANNLNDVHFSTNLGLGLKYSFLKSFEFNVEPTVKYQLNTYSSNAGNFKPYFFGIYSGISYKF